MRKNGVITKEVLTITLDKGLKGKVVKKLKKQKGGIKKFSSLINEWLKSYVRF